MFQTFPFKTPSIHFGVGTVSLLGKEVKKLGGQRVMVVTGPSIEKAGMLNQVMASLKEAGVEAEVNIQGRNTPEPSTDIAEETARAINEGGFDLVVGLGGGSILDVAKMAAALTKNPGKVRDYFGKEQVKQKGLPTVMIPTTSGTGAEVTKHAIFLDAENQVKKAVASSVLLPDVAIIDPEMTYTCPRSVTAASGIDAWIHAAEPYVSKNANPITDVLSLEAVRIITRWLGPAVADENNLEARYWMALGSLISGMVLNNAGTSLVHAMAYPIGGEFHTAHGISLTVLLVSCFEGIISARAEKFANLAQAMGENIEGLSVREAAELCMDSVLHLLQSTGLPACLPDAGIRDQDKVPRWAREAHAERRLLGRCAKNLTEDDIAEIYKRALQQR